MDRDELRALQAPLKERYRAEPAAARWVLRAEATLASSDPVVRVTTPDGPVLAGLHPATGGDGSLACSGDLLLQALVACAGVTLGAVATATGFPLRRATVRAEGDLDFRGTLGVAKDAPVGFSAIRLSFDLDTDAPDADADRLVATTERYCVVAQTLKTATPLTVSKSLSHS